MIEDRDFIPEPNQQDKAVRLNITLPRKIVDIIDSKARKVCLNHSVLIANLARKAFM